MTNERKRNPDLRHGVSEIRSLRKQVRRSQMRLQITRTARLAIQGLGTLALWTILLFFLDWAFQPAWVWRLTILLLSATAAGVWLYRRAGSVRVSLMEAAELIEQTHPELREAVINAIQLDDAICGDGSVGSPQLASAFLNQTERHADLVSPAAVASFRALRKPVLRSSIAVLAALLLLGLQPATTRIFLRRVIALQTPGTRIVNIHPGDAKCVEGHAVTFACEARGVVPTSGRIRLTYDDQSVETIPLSTEGRIFASGPTIVRDTATYRVEVGQAVSRDYAIQVIRYPQLKITMMAAPPPYANLTPQETTGGQGKYMTGSQVQIIVEGTKDLHEVKLPRNEERADFTQANSRRFEAKLSLEADLFGTIRAVDTDGLSISEPLRLEAIVDSPPVAMLNRGLPELTVLTGSSVEIAYEAHDDVGLRALKIFALTAGDERKLAEVPVSNQRNEMGSTSLDLTEWLKSPDDQLDVYAVATDNSPAARVGRSQLVTIRLVSPEESRQLVAERRKQTAERVADAARMAAEARNLAEEERWAEALETQERCSSQLTALRDDASESWSQQGELPSDLSITFEQQRFIEQLDAATESSQQAAQQIRDSLNGRSSGGPQSPPPEDGVPAGETQKRLEQQLAAAQAFADPHGASQALRDQVQDLVQHARDREPLAPSASTHEAGERAEFWEQRQRQAERLKEDLQRAKERGLTAASPWVSDVYQALNDSDLAENMAETQQALRQMDLAQARQRERDMDEQLAKLAEQLDPETTAEGIKPMDDSAAIASDGESATERWKRSQEQERLLADAMQLREQQESLRRQVAQQPNLDQPQQSNWQAAQEQIAQAADAMAQQAESMGSSGSSDLGKAAQAAAQAQQALAQGRQEQAMAQQAASEDRMEAASGKMAAEFQQTLEDCEQASQAAEQTARQLRQEIARLQQQQANDSGSPAAATQIADRCEQLAKQCEQAGADQLAEQLQDAAKASRQAGQPSAGSPQAGAPSGQPGSPAGSQPGSGPSGPPSGQSGSAAGTAEAGSPSMGQAGSPAQQAAQSLSAALQAAGQMESQAAETKAAAAEAHDLNSQQQQIARMAAQQQTNAPSGAPSITPADVSRQESLARQARELSQQVSQPDAADRLQQAADAAEAAAQAMKGDDARSAQDSKSLSARRLREAERLLARPGNLGLSANVDQEHRPPVRNTLLIDVPPEMRQQIRALFDSQKPHNYADQLLEYSTKLRVDASSEGIAP